MKLGCIGFFRAAGNIVILLPPAELFPLGMVQIGLIESTFAAVLHLLTQLRKVSGAVILVLAAIPAEVSILSASAPRGWANSLPNRTISVLQSSMRNQLISFLMSSTVCAAS